MNDNSWWDQVQSHLSQYTPEQQKKLAVSSALPAPAFEYRPTVQTTPSPNTQPQSQQPDSQSDNGSPGFTDYAIDAGRGLVAGTEGFFKSIGKLADDIGETFGVDIADDSTWDQTVHTKTWVGGLTEGITQFAWGFLPALGIVGRVGEAAGLTGSLGKLAVNAAAGAAADFTAFQGHEERLSNLIQQFPALANPVTEFLSAKKDDNWVEARFKNALEGLGLGVVGDVLHASVRGLRSLRGALETGDTAAAQQIEKETAEQVSTLIGDGSKLASPPDTAEAKYVFKHEIGEPVTPELTEKFQDTVQKNIDSGLPVDKAVSDAAKTWINFDRQSVSTNTEHLLETIRTLADPFIQEQVEGVRSLKTTEDLAKQMVDEFGMDADKYVTKMMVDADQMKNISTRWTAYRIMRNTVGERVVGLAQQIGVEPANEALKQKFKDAAGLMMKVHYATQVIQTEGARIPSAGRIMAGSVDMDVDRMFQQLDTELSSGSELSAKLINTLAAAKGDTKIVSNALSSFEAALGNGWNRFVRLHNEFYINAILSGYTTQATNVIANTARAFLLPTERAVGALMSGDVAQLRSAGRLYMGYLGSAMDFLNLTKVASEGNQQIGSTFGMAARAFWQEKPLLDSSTKAELDRFAWHWDSGSITINPIASALNGVGKMIRMPTRLMMSMDELFKNLSYRAYLRDEGYRLAADAGMTDSGDIARFIGEHIRKAYDASGRGLNQKALRHAETATFQQEATGIAKTLSSAATKHPLLRLLIPFIKTPVNIFKMGRDYTPGLNVMFKEFRDELFHSDEGIRTAARGKMMMGGMLMSVATHLAMTGYITGAGPENKNEREVLMQSGWRPYSFRIPGENGQPDTYFSFSRMDPWAMHLGMAADIAEMSGHLNDDDLWGAALTGMVAFARNVTNKTYLSGLTEALQAATQPKQAMQRWAQNRLASYVPNIVGQTVGADDYYREARGFLDALKRKTPLASTLAPKRNLFGEKLGVTKNWGLTPFAYSESVPDNVKTELARLSYGFGPPQKKLHDIDLTSYKAQDGQDAYDYLQELHGNVRVGGKTMHDAMNALVSSPKYQALPQPNGEQDSDNPRVRAIQKIISTYRQTATKQMLAKYPQVLRDVNAAEKARRIGSLSTALRVRR